MRAKPDMKPWVFTDKNKMSSFRSDTNSASVGALAFGVCRPYGAQKNVYQYLTQGLRPGLCRGIALTGLFSVSALYLLECLRVLAEMSTSYLLQCLRVLTFVSART